METPFGDDENDIDIDKMLRRIDKHTASQLSLYIPHTVRMHEPSSRSGSSGQLFRLVSECTRRIQLFRTARAKLRDAMRNRWHPHPENLAGDTPDSLGMTSI